MAHICCIATNRRIKVRMINAFEIKDVMHTADKR